MDRLLARLERHFGGLAIENLVTFLVGGMGIVFVLSMVRPDVALLLELNPRALAHGQVWRLVTYLFLPPPWAQGVWFLFDMYFLWMIGANLEAEWGAFRLNVYYGIGMAGTTAAALLTGVAVGNVFLNASLALAFATLFPTTEILVFFVIPLQVRWLGWLVGAMLAYAAVNGDWADRAAILAAVANYLLFFTGDIARFFRGAGGQRGQAHRRPSFAPERAEPADPRVCAVCGAKASEGADIRVCSCDTCKAATGGKARTLCLEHARKH
jgi:membrane associated rhomboid family serine protease